MSHRIPIACLAATLATGLTAGLAAAAPGDRCRHRDTRELTGGASGSLRVESGAGAVEIVGENGRSDFAVTAELCASDAALLEDLGVSLAADRLETSYPSEGLGWKGGYARIALTVRVPTATDIVLVDRSGSAAVSDVGRVRVEDGSGALTVERVAAAEIEDGSGALLVEDVAGEVEVRDGSGGLTLRRVGPARVRDGSGAVTVEGVSGSLEVEDGSGDLDLREIAGGVTIEDASGSIEVAGVGGTVLIESDSGGGVSARDIEGDFIVVEGRARRIRYERVAGTVELPPERRAARRR